MTPDDFIKGSKRSIKRNPKIAQLMYYSKDVESFGTGLKGITMACETAGVKVDFQLLKAGFMVVFYRPESELTNKKADKKADKKQRRTPHPARIIEYLHEHEFITNKVAREILKLADSTTKRVLADMVANDLIVAAGDRKARKYALKQGGNEQ